MSASEPRWIVRLDDYWVVAQDFDSAEDAERWLDHVVANETSQTWVITRGNHWVRLSSIDHIHVYKAGR